MYDDNELMLEFNEFLMIIFERIQIVTCCNTFFLGLVLKSYHGVNYE